MDRGGGDPPLAIGGPRQRQRSRFAGDDVAHFDGVPHREDTRIVGAHAVVDADPAASAQLEARLLGQGDLRADADRQDRQIGVEALASGYLHDEPALLAFLEGFDTHAETQRHPVLDEMVLEVCRHLRIERAHHLRRQLDERHLEAAAHQVLRHLETDEAAADDDGPRGARQGVADAPRVGNRAHDVDAGQVDSRQRRPDGARTR